MCKKNSRLISCIAKWRSRDWIFILTGSFLLRVWLRFFHRVWWSIWLRKIFQDVLCPTKLAKLKLICTFNQHCLNYKTSNRVQFTSSLFAHKLFKMLLYWHTFFQHVTHVWIHKYLCKCLLLVCIKGKLILLLDKTGYVSQETRPEFIDSQNSTFNFITGCFVSKRCIYLINNN